MTMQGFTLGATVMGLITPRAPSNDILNKLIKDQPEFYKFIDIDLSIARTDKIYDEPGTFIWVDNQFARGEVTLKLNELKFGKFDLRRQKYIQGPFFRFFITNVAGQGSIRLFISRGYQAASEPIEAINRAELAARMGSINTFDRRGDIVWMDSFDDGIEQWYRTVSGTGASITQSAAAHRSGGFSAKLVCGSTTQWYAQMSRYSPYPTLGKLGIEVSFTLDANTENITFFFWIQDGTYAIRGGFQYDNTNERLRYLDSTFTLQDLETSLVLWRSQYLFHTIKFVLDWQNREYVRAMLDDMYWDMTDLTDYVINSDLDPALKGMYPRIFCVGANGTNATQYIDDVIVTQNEP